MSAEPWQDEWFELGLHAASDVLWRGVEAQHRVATLRLVDSLDEQAELERILEASKSPLPRPAPGAKQAPVDLHYLLHTPFRSAPRTPRAFAVRASRACGTARASVPPPAPRSPTGAGAS